jgi:hypothetical protein
MRLNAVLAFLFAAGLALATPSLAQTTHGTATTSTVGRTNSATTLYHHPQQFKTETEAKSACGSQRVVWANTSSHVLHAAGSKYYGKTTHGAYMCENTATQSGYHMAKND